MFKFKKFYIYFFKGAEYIELDYMIHLNSNVLDILNKLKLHIELLMTYHNNSKITITLEDVNDNINWRAIYKKISGLPDHFKLDNEKKYNSYIVALYDKENDMIEVAFRLYDEDEMIAATVPVKIDKIL